MSGISLLQVSEYKKRDSQLWTSSFSSTLLSDHGGDSSMTTSHRIDIDPALMISYLDADRDHG